MYRDTQITGLLAFIILLATLAITSCTTANWYGAAKQTGEAQCSKQPPGAAYDDCMRQYDKTWNEYQKQRQEATKE